MVGLALGLLVAAAAVAALAQQAGQTQQLLVDARLSEALRTSTELIARHLRRAGHWRDAASAVWPPAPPYPSALPANPHGLAEGAPLPLHFSYSSPADTAPAAPPADDPGSIAVFEAFPSPDPSSVPVSDHDRFGLRLRDDTLEMSVGGSTWQALTDPAVMRVTRLQLNPRTQRLSLDALCTRPCPPGDAACPPALVVTDLSVQIDAESATHPALRRQAATRVRVRNDRLVGQCAS